MYDIKKVSIKEFKINNNIIIKHLCYKYLFNSFELMEQGQLTVKGFSNRMLPRF